MNGVFDKILASRPVNQAAARVTSRGGDHFELLNLQPTLRHADVPFPIRPIPKGTLTAPAFVNLTGEKIGRFTVIGLLDPTAAGKSWKKKAQWVVRCVCGNYETRSARVLKNSAENHACAWCLKTASLRRKGGSNV